MRTVLVNPYPYYATGTEGSVYPPLGLLYLAASVRDEAEAVTVLDAGLLRLDVAATLDRIIALRPEVVGVSVNMVTARAARELCSELRRRLESVCLVAGGPLPSAYPERWLGLVDYLVRGEGEEAFTRLIKELGAGRKPTGIPGVVVGEEAVSQAPPVDPERLPFPAYDLLWPPLGEYLRYSRARKGLVAPLLTSRGCPHNCGFCDKTVHGSRFRSRSPESVLAETGWLRTDHGVHQLDILDDNFTHDRDRATAILQGLARQSGWAVNCHNGVRVDRLTRDLVGDMKRAGVFKAGIGVESGSERVLDLIGKRIDLDQAGRAIRWFRDSRITVHGFFILGFPFETRQEIIATIDTACRLNPHYANFALFLPVPGTPIYDRLAGSGGLADDAADGVDAGFFRNNSLVRFEHLADGDIEQLYKLAWRRFYLRPAKALDIARTFGSAAEMRWVARIGWSVVRRFGPGLSWTRGGD